MQARSRRSRFWLSLDVLEDRALLSGVPLMGPHQIGEMDHLAGTAAEAWHFLGEQPIERQDLTQYILPERSLNFWLNAKTMRAALPNEVFTLRPEAEEDRAIVTLPKPDGTLERFEVYGADVVPQAMWNEYANIRTYRGVGLDDPSAVFVGDFTEQGFHAQVQSPAGWWYIDPVYQGDSEIYQTYFREDYTKNPHGGGCKCQLCEGALATLQSPDSPAENLVEQPVEKVATAGRGGNGGGPGFSLTKNGELAWAGTLRTYRAAITTDNQYYAFHSGTTNKEANVLSAIVTALNRVSGLYETELSVRFQLVANNSTIIYGTGGVNGASPYGSAGDSTTLDLIQAQIDSKIGQNNYEIGHLFSGDASFAGLAGLGVVAQNGAEGQAFTGLASPLGDRFTIDYVAHEMGHQSGGNHTFAANVGSAPANTRVEPGSASTIMGYASLGGGLGAGTTSNDYQLTSDAMFSSKSLSEISSYLSGTYDGGFTSAANGNNAPRVFGGADYMIPARSFFALQAIGTDPDGHALTYSWEQADSETNSIALSAPDAGTGAIFRPYLPTTSPERWFVRQSKVLAATTNLNGSVNLDGTASSGNSYSYARGERLPLTTRTMNFLVTARDNQVGGGGFAYDRVTVRSVNTGTVPFSISLGTGLSWTAGTSQTVTWNVAGTTGNGINTDLVRISLSTDGGLTFPIVLAASTANDGSQAVNIPLGVSSTASNARLRIDPLNSVYFAISNKMTITAGAAAPVGNISGLSFNDRNGNGVRDGEPAAPARLIYADANSNGRFDQGYPTVNVAASYPLTLANETRTRVPFNLSGVTGAVADLGVRLNITHANPGELNAALISPSGRRVELFSSLGFSGANLTNLTLSMAGASGINQTAAPYTGTFRPEGNLEEFIGESINGTWQLEIADLVAGNTGTLSNWTLLIANEFASTASPFTITTSGQNKLAPLTVPAIVGTVTDVDVKVNLTVGDTQSASFWLYNPNVPATASPVPAAAIRLFNRSPLFETNFTNTILDDQAATSITAGSGPFTGRFRPETSFLSYYDQPGTDPIAGTWQLNVRSEFGSSGSAYHVGYLGWSLLVTREFAATAFAPVAVPDNSSVTSVLRASLVGGPVQDVGVTLNLTHPDVSQVKAYLTSPVGSKVLLAANGAGANFTGTTFDDEATTKFSAGSAPYTAFFKPVEPLARFDGEDGNGNWTLTIQDTATGSTGTLNSWSLGIVAPTKVDSLGVPMPVGVVTTRGSSLFINNAEGPLSDLDITLNLTHPVNTELAAFLTSPSGTKITLVAAGTTSGANWTNTTFDDESAGAITVSSAPYTGRFRPSAALSAFDGEWANGLWTLELTDSNLTSNTGLLSSWSMSYSTGERFSSTDANGNYSFAVPAGSYTVREELPGDLSRTLPASGGTAISVTSGTQTFANTNFGAVGTVLAGPTLNVNSGVTQRSRVTSITVTGFGNISAVAAGAFTLTRTGPGTPNSPEILTATSFTSGANDTTIIAFLLPAAYTENGSLIDGNYTINVNWSLVTVSGPPVAGTTSHNFHRLFGDLDGDKDVDIVNLAQFRAASYGTYNAAFDFDIDGDIDIVDLAQFRQRYGITLP
jgi:subtilisin-like proprotein convertase family protein